jgi:hypothetical protein
MMDNSIPTNRVVDARRPYQPPAPSPDNSPELTVAATTGSDLPLSCLDLVGTIPSPHHARTAAHDPSYGSRLAGRRPVFPCSPK